MKCAVCGGKLGLKFYRLDADKGRAIVCSKICCDKAKYENAKKLKKSYLTNSAK